MSKFEKLIITSAARPQNVLAGIKYRVPGTPSGLNPIPAPPGSDFYSFSCLLVDSLLNILRMFPLGISPNSGEAIDINNA